MPFVSLLFFLILSGVLQVVKVTIYKMGFPDIQVFTPISFKPIY